MPIDGDSLEQQQPRGNMFLESVQGDGEACRCPQRVRSTSRNPPGEGLHSNCRFRLQEQELAAVNPEIYMW